MIEFNFKGQRYLAEADFHKVMGIYNEDGDLVKFDYDIYREAESVVMDQIICQAEAQHDVLVDR